MKVTTSPVGPREVELTIEPDAAFIDQAMRQAAKRISRYRPVAGYRPGKAPYALVERTFGREVILDEALHGEAEALYRQAVEAAAIEPLAASQMSIASHEPLTLKTRVSLLPETTLGDYRSIRIDPEPEVSLTEEEIDAELAAVRRRHAQVESVDRPLAYGDEAAATVTGVADGETVVDEKNAWWRVNEEMTPPGFAEAVVGMNKGETREFTLSYPAEYADEKLAGKQVTFTAALRIVYAVNLPPLDDELAKLEGDYESLEALRAALAERIKGQREAANLARESDAAVEALIDISTFDYPDILLDNEVESILENRRALVQQLGWDFNTYLRMTNKTESALRDETRPEAAKQIARELVLSEFAKAEGVTLSEQERTEALGAWYRNVAMRYGERAPEAARQMMSNGAAERVQQQALLNKAAHLLADMATGRYVLSEPVADADPDVTETSEAE